MSGALRIGAWQVHPAEGLLVRDGEQRRIQPKVMDVLLCLAEQPGELLSREDILRAVWGERAVSDEPLTRCIAELRAAFDDKAGDPQYIETLPKRGYRLIAPVEPLAEGGPESARESAHRPWWPAAVLVVLALIVGLGGAWWLARDPPVDPGSAPAPAPGEQHGPPMLAVLPFVNLSGDEGQEFLSDGLTETLTQVLARDPELRVIARTTAFSFKNAALDVREIADRLDADAVLEGSLQRDGEMLRVTAQLVDAESGTHLWAEAFDRPFDSIFAVQDEIAAEVSDALRGTLLPQATQGFGARSSAAWVWYARGLAALKERTTPSLSRSIDLFRRALEQDPSFALAWLALGDAIVVNQWYADEALHPALDEAEAAVRTALELDPGLAGAHSMIGAIEFRRGNYEASEAALRKAVSLAPHDADAWFRYGTLLNDTGRPAEALEKHRRAAELDPLAPVVHTAIGVSFEKLGRFEEALEQYRAVVAMAPDYPAGHDRLGLLLWNAFGRAGEALAAHRQALSLDPDNAWTRTLVVEMALDLDAPALAEAWLSEALAHGGNKLLSNLSRGLVMAYRGQAPADRLAHAERWLGDVYTSGETDAMLRLYRDAALELGRSEDAVERYRTHLPELFEPGVHVTSGTWGPAIDLALLRRAEGEMAHSDRLLEGAWAVIQGLPRKGCCGSGLADVEVLAISGRPEEAVGRLQQAFDAGHRVQWWWHTWRNPNLASLEDREDYQALLGRFRERAEQDRARLPADTAP